MPVYFRMANGGLRRTMKNRLSKTKVVCKSEVNESENLSYFRFTKNCQNPTTFGFGFKLRHIPSEKMLEYSSTVLRSPSPYLALLASDLLTKMYQSQVHKQGIFSCCNSYMELPRHPHYHAEYTQGNSKARNEITVSISSLTFRRLPSMQARCSGDSPFSFR